MVTEPFDAVARAATLRGLCGGAVHLPGDPAYDEARLPWNLSVDDRPAAVAYPALPAEVAEVLRAAGEAGLAVAPQGTGHGAPPLSGQLGDAVLLRTSAMTELRVDPARRVARVGAGVLWGDVVVAAGRHGLAALHTTSPGVGVVGSSLGGGLSWYARHAGLQCSALTAVELVTADGTFVRATDDHDADLLWAARGGGGGFGVVTALEFDLLPLREAYAGMLAWDWSSADRVLRGWRSWALEAPEEVTTIARLLRAPDEPWLPAEVRGRSLVVIDGTVLGDADRARAILAPLRAMHPEIDTFETRATGALADLHLDPEDPTAVYADSLLLDDLPDGAIDGLLAATSPAPGTGLLFLELRQLGGALGRASARAGVLDRMPGAFLVLGVGLDEGAGWTAVREQMGRTLGSLREWDSGARYLNMAEGADERRAWSAETAGRLAQVRRAADPEGLFVPPRPPGGRT
ncbi:FAD-binding oxidoreductase [Nocardioides coralli]|uniref:FAD-binding oxidoreductase n=1 Tax=Nocardioides coralli TaxID=2872154 RepID=UPI001CA44F79|nr:FAD-binding protein [Nocardioides coralli]QZY29117.1 FAD-binding protein [Nocardioides coralli]